MLLSNFSPKIVASDWCEWSLFNVIHVPYILLEQLFNKCFVWKQLFSKQMILSKRGLSAIVWNEIFFLKAYHWAQGFGCIELYWTVPTSFCDYEMLTFPYNLKMWDIKINRKIALWASEVHECLSYLYEKVGCQLLSLPSYNSWSPGSSNVLDWRNSTGVAV